MTKPIDNPPQVKPLERLLTPRDIAKRWCVDESQVRRAFKDVPGVINVSVTSKHRTLQYRLRYWSGKSAGGKSHRMGPMKLTMLSRRYYADLVQTESVIKGLPHA
jgi:hypothetical protein